MRLLAAFVLTAVLSPAIAHAQPRREFWGVDVDVVPRWESPQFLKFLFDADAAKVAGTDFRIGFVRGSILRGDWGVAYVHRTLKASSQLIRNQGSSCAACGSFLEVKNTTLDGIELHKFAPLGFYLRRV